MQQEIKKLLKGAESGLKKLTQKVSEIADIVKEDAIYGFRIGKLKFKELNLERQKAAKIYAIGRKTYNLYKKGQITDKEIVELCQQLSQLEEVAKKYHIGAKKLAKKIKLTP